MIRIYLLVATLLVAATGVFAVDEVVSISLINPDTDTEIRILNDGDTVDVNTDGFQIALRANTSPALVGSVELTLSGADYESRVDNTAPYTVHGDDGTADIFPWSPTLGSYTLTVTPYEYGGGTGTAGTAVTINFVVVNDITSGPPPPVAEGAYIESGGLVVMEAETEEAFGSNWYYRQDVSGFTLDGYYEWKFADPSTSVSPAGSQTILYEVDITTTGRYRFVIRSAAPDNNDHNDVWVRFPVNGAVKVQGASEGSLGTGWFKVYQNVSGDTWTYQTKTVDFDAHQIYSDFDAPGIYTIELSGRSTMFKIDRLTLYHSSVPEAVGEDPTQPESLRDDGDPPPPPVGCVAPDNPAVNVTSSTSAAIFWDFVVGADAFEVQGRIAGIGSGRKITVPGTSTFLNIFSPGVSYEWRVRSVCDGGAEFSEYTSVVTFTTPTARSTETTGDTWNMVPNPVSDLLFITGTDVSNQEIFELFDLSGRKIKSVQLQQGTPVSLSGVLPGIYLARISDHQGDVSYSEKLIVE